MQPIAGGAVLGAFHEFLNKFSPTVRVETILDAPHYTNVQPPEAYVPHPIPAMWPSLYQVYGAILQAGQRGATLVRALLAGQCVAAVLTRATRLIDSIRRAVQPELARELGETTGSAMVDARVPALLKSRVGGASRASMCCAPRSRVCGVRSRATLLCCSCLTAWKSSR